MFYGVNGFPLDLRALMQSHLNGACAGDPTIPYSPRRSRRVLAALRSKAARTGSREPGLVTERRATTRHAC
jgi:hypothetical protein